MKRIILLSSLTILLTVGITTGVYIARLKDPVGCTFVEKDDFSYYQYSNKKYYLNVEFKIPVPFTGQTFVVYTDYSEKVYASNK